MGRGAIYVTESLPKALQRRSCLFVFILKRCSRECRAEEGKFVRLKFSRTKYDATLLVATMVSVWGGIAFLALGLALGIERLPKWG
jgi:hypothetical protein